MDSGHQVLQGDARVRDLEVPKIALIHLQNVVEKDHLGRQSKSCLSDEAISAHTDVSRKLFLQFRGPTTILLQSRAARLNDVLTTRDVNEIADTAPGVISPAVTLERKRDSAEKDKEGSVKKPRADVPTSISVASVGPDGKVAFKDADDFKEIGGR